MPTWYYFSWPSNMAFHDFTKRHKPQKNLRSLLGLGLEFIPTPSLTNCWSRLKQSSYDRLFCSVHLRFHFTGKPPSEGTITYDPKIYVHSTWTPPHWNIPPIALEEHASLQHSTNSSKREKAKQTSCHINIAPYERYNNSKHFSSSRAIRTSDPQLSSVTIISKSLCGTTSAIQQLTNHSQQVKLIATPRISQKISLVG